MTDHFDLRTASAMAALGAALVLFEVLLTRVLAIALFANVAFLAIAVALLGMGVGGWLASRHDRKPEATQWRILQWMLIAAALVVLVAVLVTSILQLVPESIEFRGHAAISYGQRWRAVRHQYGVLNWPAIAVCIVLQMVPFLCGAYAQSILFARAPGAAGWIYASDLAGACAGAWSALVLLPVFGALNGVAVCALLFVGALFLLRARVPRALQVTAAGVAVLAVVVLAARPLRIRHPAGYDETRVVDVDWSALTRVSLYEAALWGSHKAVETPPSELRDPWLLVDNTSRTQVAFLGDPEFDQNMDRVPLSLRSDGDVLIIGAGGGQEILDAHETATIAERRIDAVEVAPGIPRMIRKHFSHRDGFLLDLPELHYIIADGRSFVETTSKKWSVIQMKEVNFHSLAGQESAAWSPSLLFTVEAYRTYLNRLTDDGLLSIIKFSGSSGKSKDTLHVLATLRTAADEEGLELSPRLVILDRIYAYGRRRMWLVARRPFTPEELDAIQAKVTDNGYAILRSPIAPADDEVIEEIISGDLEKASAEALRVDHVLLEPTTDDRPFGHQHVRYLTALRADGTQDPDVLMQSANFRALTLIIVLLVVTCAAVGFLFLFSTPPPRRTHAERLLVFGLLGVGFMLLEIVLIERASIWLGHPTIAFVTILTAMLLALGTGSALSSRFQPESMRTGARAGLAVAAALSVWLLPRVLEWLQPQLVAAPRTTDVVLTGVWVWLASVPLGWLLPTLLRIVGRDRALPVASGWALNGLASVLGTVAAALLVRTVGFHATSWLAFGAYALATTGWFRATSR